MSVLNDSFNRDNIRNLFFMPLEEQILLHSKYNKKSISVSEIDSLKKRALKIYQSIEEKKPEQILIENGFRIVFESEFYGFSSFLYRAELDIKNKSVIIYEKALDDLWEIVREYYEEQFEKKTIMKIFVAHELYHFLEFQRSMNLNINQAGNEICAHLFSQKCTGLSFYPWVLDLIHSFKNKPELMKDYLKREKIFK